MNAWEKANLAKLVSLNDNALALKQKLDQLTEEKKAAVLSDSMRLIVRVLFEKHEADLDKIKADLRKDALLYSKLDIDKIANDEYTKQNNPIKIRARYGKETQERFYQTVFRLESERANRLRRDCE